jgi:hypothetical protein
MRSSCSADAGRCIGHARIGPSIASRVEHGTLPFVLEPEAQPFDHECDHRACDLGPGIYKFEDLRSPRDYGNRSMDEQAVLCGSRYQREPHVELELSRERTRRSTARTAAAADRSDRCHVGARYQRRDERDD